MRHRRLTLVFALVISGWSQQLFGQRDTATTLPEVIPPFMAQSFVRYATPGECAWTSAWLEHMAWIGRRSDTMTFTRTGHPYEATTREKIQTCAARYSVSGVAEGDLLGLTLAKLATRQFDLADSALVRWLHLAGSRAARAWAMYQAVDVYLWAPEPQLTRAATYVAKLDALGAEAAVPRMLAHLDLAQEAQRRDSVPLWDRETQAALAASKLLTGNTQKEYAFEAARVYVALAQFKARQNDAEGARTVLAVGQTELVAVRPRVAQMFAAAEGWYVLQGKTPGSVQATHWVIRGTPGDIHPVSGKPAVVVFIEQNDPTDFANMAVLRRLIARYPAAELDVILVSQAEGYAHDQLMSSDAEMASAAAYFLQDLQIPANLAWWATVSTRRADGRLEFAPSPAHQAFQPPWSFEGLPIAILDKTGTLRMYATLGAQDEIMLNDIVQSVM